MPNTVESFTKYKVGKLGQILGVTDFTLKNQGWEKTREI
jgi:hypothetical protein